ncbi:hypothetical protein KUTeg_020603 [Tegillarca granosa]|uniref:Ileal sodium/bile acid cotransporter n=1 Tax=Tegillarca granosa TaxID=220873 RepID=A0ABQ9ECR5_TEGGR|nr:hypothetical protein KUTeg_020603 [Tegillarca granosa]
MENITKPFQNCSTISIGNCSTNNSTNGSSNAGTYLNPAIQQANDIILISLMTLIMLSLGCTINLSMLKQEIRRPIGVFIGLFCQFILFPAVTFGLAHALRLQQLDALGMIMLGTCPGGSISNLATYWSGGDVVLSVIMTAASTAIGTGMMPLNLWIYSRSWTNRKAVIPYVSIVIALISVLVPVAIGMVIVYKFPKPAKWITRIGSACGVLVIGIIISLNATMNSQIFTASAWTTWIAAATLPCVGLAVGYLLAFIARRPTPQRRAIAIETSAQNVALCLTLISVTFDGVNELRMSNFPSLFGCFSVFILLTMSVLFRLCDYHKNGNYKLNGKKKTNKINKVENGNQAQNVTCSRL